ncbi:hypothetical protein B566_EDAN001710 [Ephemera danica]|nr:hypothetical protein B566_EDAN001710 [Ephemera danica]
MGTVTTAPRYLLAEHRYGREEMLALFNNNARMPDALFVFPMLIVEKSQPPLALIPTTEEETRMWQRGINSDAVLRQMGKPGGPIQVTRERGRGGAVVGGGIERGRGGRGGRLLTNSYYRGFSFEEEATREAGGIPITSYSSRGRVVRKELGVKGMELSLQNGMALQVLGKISLVEVLWTTGEDLAVPLKMRQEDGKQLEVESGVCIGNSYLSLSVRL